MTWPHKLTAHQVRVNGFLTSLTPREEFALFLGARGHCGVDNNQPAFAAQCYENAYRHDPRRPHYRSWFLDAARRSGYRPRTPALASLLAQRKCPAVVRRPILDLDFPMPSATAMNRHQPVRPSTPGVAPWAPQPPAPGMLQPPTPPAPHRRFPQPYQPPVPSHPQR